MISLRRLTILLLVSGLLLPVGGPLVALGLSEILLGSATELASVTVFGVDLMTIASGLIPLGFLCLLSWPVPVMIHKKRQLDRWERLDTDLRFRATGDVGSGGLVGRRLSEFETEIDGRVVRLGYERPGASGHKGRTLSVKTPLQVVQRGTGFEVTAMKGSGESNLRDVIQLLTVGRPDWGQVPPGVRSRVRSLLESESGTFRVDDGVGVVAYEIPGVVNDPDRLAEMATVVADVADAVESKVEDGETASTEISPEANATPSTGPG